MGLPKSVKLRGKKFKLTHLPKMSDYGLCDDFGDVKRIWIRLDQSPRDFCETIIHESLHGCLPDASEECVTETAHCIGRLLWRYGYRLKDDL